MSKSIFTETDRKYVYKGRLGTVYRRKHTTFSVWSPYADSVTLLVYSEGSGGEPIMKQELAYISDGVWKAKILGDLEGKYYTYLVAHEDKTVETPDIYSRSTGLNGERTMIVDERRLRPMGWEVDAPVSLDSPADAVVCELHVRDFSMDKAASFKDRGKLSAFLERNVKNSHGDTVGLDYIESLGVTHIQLMPLMENASVDENNPSYNWGYDPLLFCVPEGSYVSNPHDGRCRITELRELVMELHRRGIGVVLDVVFNHTFDAQDSPLGRVFPDYYYRHSGNKLSNGSGCGNEIATERKMARRLIIDSLCQIVRTYHIDGFRFDLMGLMDITTLKRCEKKLRRINPDILLYGEGWTGGSSPLSEKRRAVKKNISKMDDIAVFSDDFRDGVKGSVFEDRDCGYVNGCADNERRELIKSVLCGGVYHKKISRPQDYCWAKSPLHSVNYTECHDNLTLADKLKLSMPEADEAELLRVNKLSAALVFLSQGMPFFQCGQEIMRSKPVGDDFSHNSYNQPDSVNCIKWDDVTKHRSLSDYYKGLIAIRRLYPHFRMTTAKETRAISFKNLAGGGFMMTIDDIRLVVNPSANPLTLRLTGEYDILADGERASAQPIGTVNGRTICEKQSILLLKRK